MENLRDKVESFCDALIQLPQDYTDLKDILVAFAEDILWHEPDKAPPKGQWSNESILKNDSRICRITNDRFSWVLEVDGKTINFDRNDNAAYFADLYSKLGYKIIWGYTP